MHESPVITLVTTIVALLLIAGGVSALTKRIKVPFTVALVLVGIGLRQLAEHGPAFLAPVAEHEISPDVILFVFLPTIIFESAFNLDVRQLRQNLLAVLMLAVPGLMISTGIIGGLVWWATPFDLPSSLLLGAILSATDPVAVIALFKTLGVPQRLTILVEGESLFNDATAIVAARILLGVVAGGYMLTPETALGSTVDFFTVFLGGAVVGWLLALLFGWILGRVHGDTFIETSLTTILAYLSFIVAEAGFHVSGVMATVAAGLTMGSWGRAKIHESVAEYIEHFWEYMSHLANALIFLLVGIRVDLGALYDSLDILGWVILGMLISRAVVVFGLVPVVGKLPGQQPVGRPYQAVMYWGGLRGAIALAIALSLKDVAHADVFVALVTGSVLFTLLVQALTIEGLVHRLGLDQPPLADRFGRAEGLLSAKNRALEKITDLQGGGLFSARIAEELEHSLQREIATLKADVEDLRGQELGEEEERRLMYARAFATEKAIYDELFHHGHIGEAAYRDLCHSIRMESDAARYGHPKPKFTLHGRGADSVKVGLGKLFDAVFGFTGWPERHRLRRVAKEYEVSWGRFQGSSRILDGLETLVLGETTPPEIIDTIRKQYSHWKEAARRRLDATAEQFPEFVGAMQDRLARRLLVRAETEIIENEARAGSIPTGVRDTVLKELSGEIRELRGEDVSGLRVAPEELLRKVPFFAATPPDEFAKVAAKLRRRTVPGYEIIIRQNERGDSLFLIARGVVRVLHEFENKEYDLATLLAGDFFGEMALLRGERRTATCRAVTPCVLFELRRRDFEDVLKACPAIQAALKDADHKRREELAAL